MDPELTKPSEYSSDSCCCRFDTLQASETFASSVIDFKTFLVAESTSWSASQSEEFKNNSELHRKKKPNNKKRDLPDLDRQGRSKLS